MRRSAEQSNLLINKSKTKTALSPYKAVLHYGSILKNVLHELEVVDYGQMLGTMLLALTALYAVGGLAAL